MYFDPILPPLDLPDHPRFLISQHHALSLKNKKAKTKQKPRNDKRKEKQENNTAKKKFIQNRIKHFLLTYTPGNQVGGGRVDLEYD